MNHLQVNARSVNEGGKGTNYFYLNSRNKHAPRGIGFGGQPELGRLWVDADFEECHVLRSDATFKAGALIPDSTEFQAGLPETNPTPSDPQACKGHTQALVCVESCFGTRPGR